MVKFITNLKEQSRTDLAKHTLALYNLALSILWFTFTVEYFREISTYGYTACINDPLINHASSIWWLQMCQLIQWLNLPMALLGITRTGIANEFSQLMGRSLFAFVTIPYFDPAQGPWITIAFFAFTLGETVRYPFFFFKSIGLSERHPWSKLSAHLKYNLFIVMYPLGAFCDMMTAVCAADNLCKTKAYSIHLPNEFNFTFDMAFICRKLTIPIYILVFPLNYLHVIKNRSKYYNSERVEREILI